MAGIRLEALHKSYGPTKIIHGIDGDVKSGEFVVVVGPSGCGKSTLLRMIAGLESVTAGEIHIGERLVNNLEPSERDIAMVFQNYALYPHMSVFENMSYGLKIRRVPKADIQRRVTEAAEILEIGPYLDRAPRQLSGGQRQRVAMGRAIVREPSVFLFDEPLSNLDAKLRVQMRLEIKKLQERLGITSVYVTHDQVEAMTLGDRLMVLNGGRVEQFGSPIELYERPATEFVAGFIGSPAMNFLPGVLDEDCASLRLNGEPFLILPEPIQGHAPGAVTVGLRPEHISVSSEAPNTISFKVDIVEQLGADTLIHGWLAALETELTLRLDGVRHFARGEDLHVSVLPEHVHLFDSDDGRRLN